MSCNNDTCALQRFHQRYDIMNDVMSAGLHRLWISLFIYSLCYQNCYDFTLCIKIDTFDGLSHYRLVAKLRVHLQGWSILMWPVERVHKYIHQHEFSGLGKHSLGCNIMSSVYVQSSFFNLVKVLVFILEMHVGFLVLIR